MFVKIRLNKRQLSQTEIQTTKHLFELEYIEDTNGR